jgi:hypothetical protein
LARRLACRARDGRWGRRRSRGLGFRYSNRQGAGLVCREGRAVGAEDGDDEVEVGLFDSRDDVSVDED